MANEVNVPDTGIKNATVLKEDLPAFGGSTLGYYVRYRIVSNDKNRYSHWSPYHFLPVGIIPKVNCSVTVTGDTVKVLNMVWEHPKISEEVGETKSIVFKEYDVYIKTNLSNDQWNYFATVPSTSFTRLLPTDISWFEVSVQVTLYPKTYRPDGLIFPSTQFPSTRINV